MKIKIGKAELIRTISVVDSALAAKTTLPILMNFLMETVEGKLKISSTDLEMGVEHYSKSEIEKEGSITIPAQKFSEILKSLPESEDVDLSVGESDKVTLRCGPSRFSITGAPKSEYPILPSFPKDGSFSVKSSIIAEMIRKTIFSTSDDAQRHVLNGVSWVGQDGTLKLTATDGRRLAVCTRDILPEDSKFSAIVPTKVLAEILRVISVIGDSEMIEINVTDSQIGFRLKETTIVSRLVGGNFPNCDQVIPKKWDQSATIGTKELIATTSRAALCAAEKSGSVKYALKESVLTVTAQTQNNDFSEEIAVEYSGPELKIVFNPKYVVEALKHVDTEKTVLALTTPSNPALLLPKGSDNDDKFVIMPMTLNS